MIQVLGLRPYFNKAKNKWDVAEKFFEKGWRFQSVRDLFENYEKMLANDIPKDEQFNIYFTVADCFEGPGRVLQRQTVIHFDIDNVPDDYLHQALSIATNVCDVDPRHVGSIASGHGLQFFIPITTEITDDAYFADNRMYYKTLCERIQTALTRSNVPGKVDSSVWSVARLMRFPGTINRKPHVGPDAQARVLTPLGPDVAWDLREKSGLPIVHGSEQVSEEFLSKYPPIDQKAVQTECMFLKWSRENQKDVKEYQWYALLSILGRLKDGKRLAHEYSNKHPGYSEAETTAKLDQALAASGPRTCENVRGLWSGCTQCPHYGKVTSPVLIRGEDFIPTEGCGFHSTVIGKDGAPRAGKPNIVDLHKYFMREHTYIRVEETRDVYVYDGKKWDKYSEARLENYADKKFEPKVNHNVRREFVHKVLCNNVRQHEWFSKSTHRKINFNNGTFDIETLKLEPHSNKHGFRAVLDYDYDESAQCPRFDKFLEEVTCDRKELADIILEYMGWSFANDDYWMQKCLVLLGEGANGKSTLVKLIKAMVGSDNCASGELGELGKDPAIRQMLDGKLINISEETSLYSVANSAFFKNATGGGEISVKQLYSQPYSILNRAKFILLCNELPINNDPTAAFYRRLLLIPFDNKFQGDKADGKIDEKLAAERPGIFNRVITAYRRLLDNKGFTESKVVTDSLTEYADESSSLFDWFEDNFSPTLSGEDYVFKTRVYANYVEYCKTISLESPMSNINFWRKFKRLGKGFKIGQIRENGNRKRVIFGLKELESAPGAI